MDAIKNHLKTSILYDELKELSENIHYKIHYEYLLKELNISYEMYVSLLYNKFQIIDMPDVFHKDNFYLLVDILKHYNQQELLLLLKKKGMYFESNELIEWLDYFISIVINLLSNHNVNLQSLDLSLSGCINPYEGFLFYCDLNIDEDYLIKKAIHIYLTKKNIKENAFNFFILSNYIYRCLESKIITFELLYENLFNKLYKISIENNFIKKESFKNNKQFYNQNQYFKILEIQELPSTKEELRKIYLSQLKKYHPDKNPEGLEKTKQIIEAYAKILSNYE